MKLIYIGSITAGCSGQQLAAMSSLLSHNKDQLRIRKTLPDSSPTSSTATAKSPRVRPAYLYSPFSVCLITGYAMTDISKFLSPDIHMGERDKTEQEIDDKTLIFHNARGF